MKQALRRIFDWFIAARQRKADALVLEYLDEHALKDIGLEGWHSPLGRHASALRTRDTLAWRAFLGPSAGGLQ